MSTQTKTIDFPMYHKKIDFSNLDKSVKRNDYGDKPRTQIELTVNCPENGTEIPELQMEVIHFIKENSEAIENSVFENIYLVSDFYVEDYISGSSHGTEEDEEAMSEYFSSREVAKSCFTISSITILGARPEHEGEYALNFNACWDQEHGFAMRFKGLSMLEKAGSSEFYDC